MDRETVLSSVLHHERVAGDASPERAMVALHALGQQARLSIFRLLVSYEPCGLAAGAIAHKMRSPQNTVSAHLAILARAQLAIRARKGRSVIYRADMSGMHWVFEYLLEDCCRGDPTMCAAVISRLRRVGCLSPPTKSRNPITRKKLNGDFQI